jgi:ubiquinone/menaquinone biosynthesis C-methylase UbiE
MRASLSPLQTYYASRAAEYDVVYAKPERQSDLRKIEQWLPSVLYGRNVLEIACGTGYWTQFIATAAHSIYAIDSAEETIKIARQRVSANNVIFTTGDAYVPQFKNRSFDAAFAGFWFSHVPSERRREFLISLNAALQPGAKVILLDNHYVEGSSSLISEHDAFGNTYQSRTLKDGSRHKILKNFPSEEQLHTLLTSDLGHSAKYTSWPYFWAFEYDVPHS